MNFQEKLEKICRAGRLCGGQSAKGAGGCAAVPPANAPTSREIAAAAFRHGARDVVVHYNDEALQRIRLDNASLETLKDIPQWLADSVNYYAERDAVMISIAASNPRYFRGGRPRKGGGARLRFARGHPSHDRRPHARQGALEHSLHPHRGVGEKGLPRSLEREAVEKLWEAIFTCVRMDEGDPVAAWKQHNEQLHRRTEYLNEMQFDSLHYQNSWGPTSPSACRSITSGAAAATLTKRAFSTCPTFRPRRSSPCPIRTASTAPSKAPCPQLRRPFDRQLFHHLSGRQNDRFSAETGYEALKSIFDTDEGALRLGKSPWFPTIPVSPIWAFSFTTPCSTKTPPVTSPSAAPIPPASERRRQNDP